MSASNSKILWGKPPKNADPTTGNWQDSVTRANEHGWFNNMIYQAPDGSVVTVKAGNKPYGLTASTKSDYSPERVIATEKGLMSKYRLT